MRSTITVLAGVLALGAGAATSAAQSRPLYLTAGEESKIWVIQNGVITAGWTTARPNEYPIAVSGDVRTLSYQNGQLGSQYTLDGTYTGTSYSRPSGANGIYDGTTDGTHNYLVNFIAPQTVYQTDRSWGNATALFTMGGNPLGIAYDVFTNSLWISQWGGTQVIGNYAMDGTLLSSFVAPTTEIAALAFDQADGTLWFHDRNTSGQAQLTFYQYSTTGQQLQRVAVSGLTGQNILGGEFDANVVATPEPGSLILLSTGLAGVIAVARRRKPNRDS